MSETDPEPYGASMAAAYAKHIEKHRRICEEARAEDARKAAEELISVSENQPQGDPDNADRSRKTNESHEARKTGRRRSR